MSGVPFLGFGPLPGYKAPIIDLHGRRDTVIPYSAASHGSYGEGPRGEVATVVSYDGMFYLEKPSYVQYLGSDICHFVAFCLMSAIVPVSGWGCDPAPVSYTTHMDQSIWARTHLWQCLR